MEYIISVYFLVGVAVGYLLAGSPSFGVGPEKSVATKHRFALGVAGLWPIALLNYLFHFRRVERRLEEKSRQD